MRKFIMLWSFLAVLTAICLSHAAERPAEWTKVRNEYVAEGHDFCEICGSKKDIEVHHVKPWAKWPDLRYEKSNLITLCRSKYWGFDCHWAVGHGGNTRWENPWVRDDVKYLKDLISKDKNAITDGRSDEYLKYIRARVKEFNNIGNKGL